ncbi:cob(I)yrinic acid a,c-diamide adenosyltransferase [Roseixanthobacter glucoisosaccharinicivorans]|uniref:cob(I)yrinic acid a,c-diamide adenosyltransferase n=1 Tax=Roseixanthobacter glucoisosaccharinicivorans TaxID=3119923 RepID=UPI003728CD01
MSSLASWSTAAGDGGMTRLATGARVEKDSPTVELIGAVEELAGWLAVLAEGGASGEAGQALAIAQNDVHELLQQVAAPGAAQLSMAYVRRLDGLIGRLEADLPVVAATLIPGGSLPAAHAAVARAVCRRAERRLVSQAEIDPPAPGSAGIAYVNRLGDLLALLARAANRDAGRPEPRFDRALSLSAGAALD